MAGETTGGETPRNLMTRKARSSVQSVTECRSHMHFYLLALRLHLKMSQAFDTPIKERMMG